MSKSISEARAKRSVTVTATRPALRTAKTSPCSVAMWACSTGVPSAPSAAAKSAAASSPQRAGSSPVAASTSPSPPRIAAPRRSGDISARKASAAPADSSEGGAVAAASGMSAKIPTVTLARASWIITVVICAIAAVLFAFSGYTGYAITLVAVGLAASVNLLPPA
jgi:hypothetical protein